MIIDSTLCCFVSQLHKVAGLLCACGIASLTAACSAPPVTKDFSGLSTATRIEVHTTGVEPLAVVSDPGRIKAARAFIQHYEKGWKSPRFQGGVIPRRRFDFWDGNRYLGEFGINRDTVTTDNYYQEVPAEEIARIAAVFELEWPPKQ